MRRTELVMGGMPFTIDVPAGGDERLLERCFALLREIDRRFSPFIGDSEIARMNAWTLAERDASPEVREVLALCRAYQARTNGYFSAWHCGVLDPCGLVKGWAIARVCRLIEAAGHDSYVVDGAGDVFVRGTRPDGASWRVGIRHPVCHDRVAAVLAVTDAAVATSGTYEKGAHIRDPVHGRIAGELLSVTILGRDIVAADAYATAAFAMGREGLAFMEKVPGYEAFAIDLQLQSACTSGFEAFVASAGADAGTPGR